MTQANIVAYSVLVGYTFFYFFLSFGILDLFQIWIFGIFRFADIQVVFFNYYLLVCGLVYNKGGVQPTI